MVFSRSILYFAIFIVYSMESPISHCFSCFFRDDGDFYQMILSDLYYKFTYANYASPVKPPFINLSKQPYNSEMMYLLHDDFLI